MASLLIAALLAAAPAPQLPPPPSPEMLAAARAEADTLLKAAGAEDLFINETGQDRNTTGAILLRHKASGFQCVMNPGVKGNQVIVFPRSTRGDDVGCTSRTFSDYRTMTITRTTHTGDENLAGAIAALKLKYPKAKPVEPQPGPGGIAYPPSADLPEPKVAVFTTGRTSERIDVETVNGWSLMFRYSTPPGIAESHLLDSFWKTRVVEANRYNKSKPAEH